MPRGTYDRGVAPTCPCPDPWKCTVNGGRYPHRKWGYRIAEGVTDQNAGRRFRPTDSGFKTETAARSAMRRVVVAYQEGRRVDDGGKTIRQMFDWWLDERRAKRPTLSSNTLANYEREADEWCSYFGDVKADALTYSMINAALKDMGRERDNSERPTGYHGRWVKQLSIESLKRRLSVLKNMLNLAYAHNKVSKNEANKPMSALGQSVDQATEDENEWPEEIPVNPLATRWGPEETADFLDFIVGHKWETLFSLYVFSAARRAEWLGARRSGFANKGLTVAGTVRIVRRKDAAKGKGVCPICNMQHKGRVLIQRTKNMTTTASEVKTRWVPLPAEGVELLKRYLAQQEEHRKAIGDAFVDHYLIFSEEDGTPIHPGAVTKEFERLVKEAGLPPIRLHDLRHNAASLFIAAGINIEVVAKMTGHSVQVCREIYTHLTPELTSDLFQRANDTVVRLTKRKWEKPEWARDAYDEDEDDAA